jgi:cytoskeletal protein RodZ
MTFEQIGQKLKATRESQGLTLNQIWEKTKIPMHHLQSMETGVTDDLPETVYVAGFIKRYADVLGLNGQALSDEYRRDAAPENAGNGNGHFMRPAKPVAQSVLVVPTPHMSRTRIESGRPSLLKLVIYPAIWIIMMIVLVSWVIEQNSNSRTNQPDPSILSLASTKFNQVPATAPAVSPLTSSATQPPPTATAPARSQNISITTSRHVWLDVKSLSSGETLFNGSLETGDRRDFKDAQGIRIHAGDAGAVNVEYEGKSERLGPALKVVEKTYMTGNQATASATGDEAKTAGATGSNILGGATTTKPPVKKTVKKPGTDGTGAHKRYRSIDEAPSKYMPGEFGGTRSIDVPYRYTEGRLDTE